MSHCNQLNTIKCNASQHVLITRSAHHGTAFVGDGGRSRIGRVDQLRVQMMQSQRGRQRCVRVSGSGVSTLTDWLHAVRFGGGGSGGQTIHTKDPAKRKLGSSNASATLGIDHVIKLKQ